MGQETTDGDDVTRGFGDDDFFAPSLGDDTLIGLDGNDTYYFGRGFEMTLFTSNHSISM